jgi:glycosyltransferase involved in cell wall biosynthesis
MTTSPASAPGNPAIPPRLSVVIPLFNGLALTRRCLETLRATLPAGLAHEIILVDDGSTDGTREIGRAHV